MPALELPPSVSEIIIATDADDAGRKAALEPPAASFAKGNKLALPTRQGARRTSTTRWPPSGAKGRAAVPDYPNSARLLGLA
jgi:hypothetical protein